ncbi:MAG: hypothetical protein BGN91_14035 [Nitrobacter sp. 62-13]|jgi:hypothetical protein|uniref:hypothetical protein n=1 Tax=Nitrobacter sp. 62-13 TaxID=1895797 RepID=UPI00095E2802|nr:hypothetical protein [Nitrobacter sp. 62-13]OJU29071.1 MAG: hypothetical protein BGN91_14035 [Nitrobacter sp. 62-13]
MNETERAQDEKSRLALGVVLTIFVFFLTELVFIGRYDNGFLWGLIPAACVGASVGWLAYRSLWFGIALGIVFEILFSLI